MTFEVRVGCASCLVEGTRIETWDNEAPSCRLGLPLNEVCRLCGQSAEARVVGTDNPALGTGCPGCGEELDEDIRTAHRCPFCGTYARTEETEPSTKITELAVLRRRLDAWASHEGVPDGKALVEAYFVLPTIEALLEAMLRGDAVETSFDVVDYLFSGGGGGGGEPAVMREEEAPRTERMPAPYSRRTTGGVREELLALASVAAADGDASPDDRVALARAAQRRLVAPLRDEDLRVWRPNEIEPPPTMEDRERVLVEMFQMAWSDGELDDSELRVIRDYARTWAIDPERLREWSELYSFGDRGSVERWFRRIGLYLFPAR